MSKQLFALGCILGLSLFLWNAGCGQAPIPGNAGLGDITVLEPPAVLPTRPKRIVRPRTPSSGINH